MNSPLAFDRVTRTQDFDGYTLPAERPAGDPYATADSNSIRWVFAATVLFWVVVYVAGSSFL